MPPGWDVRGAKGLLPGVGKGWDYAPGASVAQTVNALAAKPQNWDYRIAKAFMANLPDATRDAMAIAYRALPSVADDARRFAQAIYEGRSPAANAPVRTLGLVHSDEATRIAQIIEQDVARFDYRVSQDSVRHVIKNHGAAATELPRGQRAVVAADFAQLPQILSSPDSITGPNLSEIDEILVHFIKHIEGELFTATFAIHSDRRSLTLKTMLVRKKQE